MNKTLIINRDLCRQILTQDKVIPVMKNVLKSISSNETKVLQRAMIHHDNGNNFALMPASVTADNVTGAKVIIFPGKETAAKGTRQGIIPLFDTETGALKAVVDAGLITVIRTRATSRRATDILAKKSARSLAIIGAGKEGIEHINAIMNVRRIDTVYIYNRTPERAQKAVSLLSEKYSDVSFTACETADKATENADIICTTTTGRTEIPLISYKHIKRGAHINAVGACSSAGREIDAETISNAKLFTDWNDACLRDAGDFLIPLKNGEITELPPLTEAGEVILGTKQGRTNDDEITLFESVGISAEDIAAAEMIYEYALENGLGIGVEI